MNIWEFDVERPFCVLDVDFYVEALNSEWVQLVYGLNYSCRYYKIVRGREYWRAEDNEVYTQILEKAFDENPNFLMDYSTKTQAVAEKLSKKTKQLFTVDWHCFTEEDLLQEWNSFAKAALCVSVAINGRPDFIEDHIYPVLEKLQRKLNWEDSVENLLAIINNVDKSLAYRDEPLSLLKVGQQIQQDPKLLTLFELKNSPETIISKIPSQLQELIEAHRMRYSWLKIPYAAHRVSFTTKDYVQRLQYLVKRSSCSEEIERIEELRLRDKERFNKIIETATTQYERILIQATRDFAFLRTYIAEVFDCALVTARDTLLKEVATRLGLFDAQIASMTIQEICDSILQNETIIPYEELNRRAEEYAYILEDDAKTIVTDSEIAQYEEIEKISEDENMVLSSSVSGMVANPGGVVGTAKILLSPEDNHKVNVGDIIIATMTTPEYISAMEKASAFVTDEGGITCHAAITSREFGVPCIVGTEIATRVFKDNDIVRVDAEKGLVQKI